jgi:hypothetical protein
VGRKKKKKRAFKSLCVARFRCAAKYWEECGYYKPFNPPIGHACKHNILARDENGVEYAYCKCRGAQRYLFGVEAM